MESKDPRRIVPILEPGHTFASITDKISSIVLARGTSRGWLVGFTLSFALVMLLLLTLSHLVLKGIGIWGNNVPVGWGFDIINFVWWIGIGHAGTLISAILLLLNQSWRTSINRFAEAMTLFAVACAGLYPLFHTGRPWLAYWLLPYPNSMELWPQFRSPLVWDVFAVSTYATVSALFWFVGLIPDLATLRDGATNRWVRAIYGVLALGWRGSVAHWHRYETAYLLLAGLSTPLVLSVHTVVSFDFAIGIIPGWHATIFPPYFVAGAIYAGFAMVLLIAIPLRAAYGLSDFITMKHLENMGKVMLVTGLIVVYGYVMEAFFAWYSANPNERYMMWNRMTGPYATMYWSLIFCNAVVPQLLWFRRFRTRALWLFLISIVVSVGMWLERFVIIVTSLHRDFMPSSWGMYTPTRYDWSMFVGTIGLFLCCLFLFIRFLPVISIFEMRTLVPDATVKDPNMAAEARMHGILAEFGAPIEIVSAARRAREAGYTMLDAYSPFPIEALAEAAGHRSRGRLPFLVLAGGIGGGLGGYLLQYWTAVHAYPLNVGGKPFHSWPAFIPVTFECTILGAALFAVFGMLALNGLPRPYHPVFNVPEFRAASRNRFFLCIEARDPKFDLTNTRRFLESLSPAGVYEVEP